MSLEFDLSYDVKDINNSVMATGALLRAANAIRLTVRDLSQLGDDPSFSRVFWTIIQISRTYTALRRIIKLVQAEMASGASYMGIAANIVTLAETPTIDVPLFDLSGLSMRVDAFRENLPIGLEGIDLTNLPEDSRTMLEAIFEEDAEQTVNDAKRILDERMASYVSPWIVRPTTGFLRDSIRWEKQTDGVRLIADAPYAWWVEDGQRTFPGYQYMQTAIEYARLRLPEKIRLELNGLLFNEIT